MSTLLTKAGQRESANWGSAPGKVELQDYMTIGKTIALTKRTFVVKVMSLLFNMPSRLVTAFLPRSKHRLISRLAVTICSNFGA